MQWSFSNTIQNNPNTNQPPTIGSVTLFFGTFDLTGFEAVPEITLTCVPNDVIDEDIGDIPVFRRLPFFEYERRELTAGEWCLEEFYDGYFYRLLAHYRVSEIG